MPHAVTIPRGAPYVLVTIDGPMTRELSIEAAVAAKRLAATLGLRRYFYDLRLSRNIESVAANYEHVHHDIPPLDLDRSARVAMLVSPEDHSHDFVETVGVNEGYSMRIFRDEKAALRWLTI